MMRDRSAQPEEYSVELEQQGREGWLTYIENGKQLKFPVEQLGIPAGVGISVPTEDRWNAYCDKQKAEWAKDRREQIVQRVAQGGLRQRYPGGYFDVTDQWINLRPGPSLRERLL